MAKLFNGENMLEFWVRCCTDSKVVAKSKTPEFHLCYKSNMLCHLFIIYKKCTEPWCQYCCMYKTVALRALTPLMIGQLCLFLHWDFASFLLISANCTCDE